MSGYQSAFSAVTELAVTFFVPAVVWTTLIAGLYQLVRDRIRQAGVVPQATKLTKIGESRQVS